MLQAEAHQKKKDPQKLKMKLKMKEEMIKMKNQLVRVNMMKKNQLLELPLSPKEEKFMSMKTVKMMSLKLRLSSKTI